MDARNKINFILRQYLQLLVEHINFLLTKKPIQHTLQIFLLLGLLSGKRKGKILRNLRGVTVVTLSPALRNFYASVET